MKKSHLIERDIRDSTRLNEITTEDMEEEEMFTEESEDEAKN